MVNRRGFIVHYQGKKVIEALEALDASIYYTSKKQHYTVFYVDANREKEIRKQLNQVKGFKHLSETLLYDESYNFDENTKTADVYQEALKEE